MAVIIWIIKDCYYIQSTVIKQQLSFTACRYVVYLGVELWLQGCISIHFQKIAEVVGWIKCLSDGALRIKKKMPGLCSDFKCIFFSNYYSVIKLKSGRDSFQNFIFVIRWVLGWSGQVQVSVHQEWGHSLAATASCLYFLSQCPIQLPPLCYMQ